MATLLCIDTAIDRASTCISRDGVILAYAESNMQKEHASFLHNAIVKILSDAEITLFDLDAIAITGGPGSYTGLRVGMASAKGLCFALQKPMIAINTLEVMAAAAMQVLKNNYENNTLLCPMIDARRMEVFTALYTTTLQVVDNTKAVIVDENFLSTERLHQPVICFGNGSEKFKPIVNRKNISFITAEPNAVALAVLAEKAFLSKKFENLAYAEPHYHKAFYTAVPR